ncbi:MAG: ferredoxin--NADP reductase [Bdellovibrionales bacterium]|nr:ferredoxin--NADP reductase [Bdellovibrionales bacterium]
MAEYQHNATIVAREDFNPELSAIRIQPDDAGTIYDFDPGQYAEVAIIEPPLDPSAPPAKLVRRQFSIASAKGDTRGLEFYIVLVRDGYLTPKLWKLGVGDRIWMNPKVKGKFTLDPVPPGKDLVMIATGTGLAPFLSMHRTYGQENPPWRRFTIIHGARYERDLGYRRELEDLAASDPHFFYISSLTREPEGSTWQGRRGRVGTILTDGTYEKVVGSAFVPDDCQVFLCGNPAMIDETQTLLESRGFQLHKKKEPGNIHIERYW